jgi:predicted metal-binding protein
MSKPVLFVCKSCNHASQADLEPSQGACLLNRLNELNGDKFVIRAVECLWMCERGCVVAVAATDQPTYLFTDLSFQESPEALLEFAELYLNRQGKSIPFNQIPQVLQSENIARIPPI